MARKPPVVNTEAYCRSVALILVTEFPDLDDGYGKRIVEEAVRRQFCEPVPHFEVIVDSPVTANWRLKRHEIDAQRVVLSYYGFSTSSAQMLRCDRINRNLAAVWHAVMG